MRALIGLPLVLALTLPGALFAQEESSSILTVGATAHVQREPDQATISLAVQTMAETVAQAAEQNATRTEAVFQALRNLGIPETHIRTTSYGTRPNYGRGDEPRLVGHNVSNYVEVRLESIERVGETIGAAIRAGANEVSGISFGLSDPSEARHAALEQAITKARGEAEAMAAAIGESLGGVVEIRNEASPSVRALPVIEHLSAEASSSEDLSTPIRPEAVDVSATVTIAFRLGTPSDPEGQQ